MPDTVAPPAPVSEVPIEEQTIPVKAYLGPIILEIPAKPAQVAIVVRMATQELIKAGIIVLTGLGLGAPSGAPTSLPAPVPPVPAGAPAPSTEKVAA